MVGCFGLCDDHHHTRVPHDLIVEANRRLDIWALLQCGGLSGVACFWATSFGRNLSARGGHVAARDAPTPRRTCPKSEVDHERWHRHFEPHLGGGPKPVQHPAKGNGRHRSAALAHEDISSGFLFSLETTQGAEHPAWDHGCSCDRGTRDLLCCFCASRFRSTRLCIRPLTSSRVLITSPAIQPSMRTAW